MVVGKAVHSGIEHNFRQKIESRCDLPMEEMLAAVTASFEGERPDAEFDTDPGKEKDRAVTLARLYHEEVAPSIQPVAVEQRAEIEFEGQPYTYLGFIDLIDEDGVIRDTKTTGRTPPENTADNNLQLISYAMLYRTLTGQEESGVALDYLVSTKTPKIARFQTQVTQHDIERLLRLIQMVDKGIREEIFFPNPNCWDCSKPGKRNFNKNMEVF